MKYVNAHDILPGEILSEIQKYYQGGYLYIPMENSCKTARPTDYKTELEKRNQHIYLRHLEGKTNGQLGRIYHLSESSIRRIIFKEKGRYQNMQKAIEEILPLWGIEHSQIKQIYPSAWEIDSSYVLKKYDDINLLERNIKTSAILSHCDIPVAKVIPLKTGESYATHQNSCFLMTKKLPGSNISDRKNLASARSMGCAIAQLHEAFARCEREITFWDNSLLNEIRGWVRETLEAHEWQLIDQKTYAEEAAALESVYHDLPKQLIHRDVHFGNFLFHEGAFSGYIDFDLSQRNIRIFDICYFLTGLLSEDTDDTFTQTEWLESVTSVIAGYESVLPLSAREKDAVPCVMKCIEILCAAYFIRISDTKRAQDAVRIFHFIQDNEEKILNFI